jgi:hypothetical protein
MKNPYAVALGSLGGKKSSSLLSPIERKQRAIKAVTNRELKRRFKKIVDIHNRFENGEKLVTYPEYTEIRIEISKLGKVLNIDNKELASILKCSIARLYHLRLYNGVKVPASTKDLVKQKYNYRCVRCGRDSETIGELQIHHIGESNNHSIDNLILLCIPCHNLADIERRKKLMENQDEIKQNTTTGTV